MHLPPALVTALSEPNAETVLVIFMFLISLLLVAVAFEPLFLLVRVRLSMRGVGKVVRDKPNVVTPRKRVQIQQIKRKSQEVERPKKHNKGGK